MIRGAESFRATGEALYGQEWQGPMGSELEVAERTIRRWASGDSEVPEGVWDQLADLCARRARTLEQLASDIRSPGLQTQVNAHMRPARPR